MRSNAVRLARSSDLRRLVERLDGLPIRPATARAVLDRADIGDAPLPPSVRSPARPRGASGPDLDPGWVLAKFATPDGDDLTIVRDLPWWPRPSGPLVEALQLLWRRAVAMAGRAGKLAVEAGEPNPAAIARAGLLGDLGLWAWAVVEPASFVEWFAESDPARRVSLERERFGCDRHTLGMTLAERWGCEPLVVEAIWLQGIDEPATPASRPLQILALASKAADASPWSLAASAGGGGAIDPRSRLLVAEVQSRCSGPFVDPDASPREEMLSRDNARLRLELGKVERESHARARFVASYADARLAEDPEHWAERAGLAWCDEPGVSAARVVWLDQRETAVDSPRVPEVVLPLGSPGRRVAEVQLWSDPAGSSAAPDAVAHSAWSAWAADVAARRRLMTRLEAAGAALRERAHMDQPVARANLDALAEFAAGAGHELNNPLAVILGRAQLLLAKQSDPEAIRSLRAIISQAQRTNRILRDLMYFARTPEPRVKLCQPDEIVRVSVRDLQHEAEARGVRLSADLRGDSSTKAWADPDALRQVADCLIRNALEASPGGGQVVIASTGSSARLDWTVSDGGKGISPQEAIHLYDPFFCGRQAGRGLGLGLPRVSRIVDRAGGEILWNSTLGRGTSVRVTMPLPEAPRPITEAESQPRSA